MNIHYHGTNVTPACGGDNVTKTLINSGSTFVYDFVFPTNEPPGLYWYHPHVHGLAERDLLGGASGALVVDPRGGKGEQGRGYKDQPDGSASCEPQFLPVPRIAHYPDLQRGGDVVCDEESD